MKIKPVITIAYICIIISTISCELISSYPKGKIPETTAIAVTEILKPQTEEPATEVVTQPVETQIDEDTIQHLVLAMEPSLQLQPGDNHSFSVGLVECCYVYNKVDVEATWSISPTVGATIDPKTGFFSVDENTSSGAIYTVTADIYDGRAAPSIEVYIYSLEDSPLIGHWVEEKQYTCSTGEEIKPAELIGELKFDADGTFSVTWFPFEIYKDYWGTYSYNVDTGELILTIDNGNNIPEDFDGVGFARIDEYGSLMLDKIWLGVPNTGMGSTNCSHLFLRY